MSSIDVSSVHREPIIQRDLAELYNRRAARLRALAEGHEQADYLLLAADRKSTRLNSSHR